MYKRQLKALSYPDIDIRKTYPIERALRTAAGRPVLFYKPWDHVVHYGDHDIPVRIFSPETEGEHAILLFFHGGGWVTGNIDSYDKVCRNMAKLTDRSVVSVDYRLAPEYRFPAAPEDCYAVAREIFLDLSLFGMRADQITLIGDSAGANLAAAVSPVSYTHLDVYKRQGRGRPPGSRAWPRTSGSTRARSGSGSPR